MLDQARGEALEVGLRERPAHDLAVEGLSGVLSITLGQDGKPAIPGLPLAIVIAAFASDETRWGETLVFGGLMTLFCIGLFKFALGLPIPLAPWVLGY